MKRLTLPQQRMVLLRWGVEGKPLERINQALKRKNAKDYNYWARHPCARGTETLKEIPITSYKPLGWSNVKKKFK